MTVERPSGNDHPRELAWSLADLVDVGDLHPLIAGLVLELPYGANDREIGPNTRRRGGRQPDWFEWRRDQWVRALCSALDLLFEVVPDCEDDGEAILLREAVEIPHEATRLGLPAPRSEPQRQLTPAAEADATVILTAEVQRLRAQTKTAEDEASALRAKLRQADLAIEELRAAWGKALKDVERLTQEANAKRATNSMVEEKSSTVQSAALPGIEIDAAPCKIDGCTENGPRQGRWANVCAGHQRAAKFGAVLLIGGVEYTYKETAKNVGRLIRKPAPPKPAPFGSSECCQPGCIDEAAPSRIYCGAHDRKRTTSPVGDAS